jgi:hypothetical protein
MLIHYQRFHFQMQWQKLKCPWQKFGSKNVSCVDWEPHTNLGNPLVLAPSATPKSPAVHDSQYTLGTRSPPTERDDKNGDRAVYFLRVRAVAAWKMLYISRVFSSQRVGTRPSPGVNSLSTESQRMHCVKRVWHLPCARTASFAHKSKLKDDLAVAS